MQRNWTAPGLCALGALAAGPVLAQAPLADVVVTATRLPQSSFDLPMAVDVLTPQQIQQGQSQVNLSESMMQLPGVSVQSRQNYAQDLQISMRGFGARSAFGLRGVRLFSDGIPGTMPDGQGQFSQFDLGSADRIEVLRGPFSALYGNSSGGVISIFTQDGPPGFEARATTEYGSLDTQRYALLLGGDSGPVNYVADLSHFQTDGYRGHSEAQRNLFNSKVRYRLDDLSSLTLVANAIVTPFVQDPMGLTAAQVVADPQQAGTGAVPFNTRKSLSQEQVGATYTRQLSAADDFTAMLYDGHRQTTQFQSIPVATQLSPDSPGGVIDLARGYGGVDAHLSDRRSFAGTELTLTGGVSYDNLDEHRSGYLNYVGTDLGVEGALRRDETNLVHDLDEYLQGEWALTSRLHADAGVRNSVVDISDHSHLLTPGTLPLSGTRYSATNPVAGLSYSLTPGLDAYFSFGRGFETPTLIELAYRSVTGNLPGMNFALQPARSSDYETGIKARGEGYTVDADVFYIRTTDELGVLQSAFGRSVYENIGATERRGAELEAVNDWGWNLSTRLAYTYLHAVVADAYSGCAGTPCTPDIVPAGNFLPAIPENILYGGITWTYPRLGFSATLETLVRSRIYADDRNTGYAGGYWTENVRTGFQQRTGAWQVSEFLRVENLFDKRYVGSVIVDDANSRFFEPAPGFGAFLMVSAQYLAPR
ncbi:MAG TPA: TonB-dependent receptor [Steroidobacteraceae bacterium]|nr:TonB-dependent receptor [Steroidobacteraceae bacterium]